MTVTFIKRECDRHPGCYTMSEKCERCHDEEFDRRIAAIFADLDRTLGKVLGAAA